MQKYSFKNRVRPLKERESFIGKNFVKEVENKRGFKRTKFGFEDGK